MVRIVAALSCDRAHDYRMVADLLEKAFVDQTSEPLLSALWSEDVNLCVQALHSVAMTRNEALAEPWLARLDASVAKLFPGKLVEGLANIIFRQYQQQKIAEEQAKQGPGLGQMLG